MIEVIDFHKTYQQTVAVAGLSFRVPSGKILGLVGPNGAGKTTTLRALAGIIPPTRGRFFVAGHDVIQQPLDAKRELAYVPDDPRLFEPLTVWEHLEFIASAYDVKDFAETGERLLAEFELTEKRDTVAQELSRGMRQKVAICAAYLHAPKVVLFDEPLTGLDPRAIRTMKDSVLSRAREGSAVVISSHLLALVEDLCSDLLILHKGRSLYTGPIADARDAIAGVDPDASLEDVFLQVTEQ